FGCKPPNASRNHGSQQVPHAQHQASVSVILRESSACLSRPAYTQIHLKSGTFRLCINYCNVKVTITSTFYHNSPQKKFSTDFFSHFDLNFLIAKPAVIFCNTSCHILGGAKKGILNGL